MTKAPHRWTPCRRCGDINPEGTMWHAHTLNPRWKRGLVCSPCRDLMRADQDESDRNQGTADAAADYD